MFRTVAVICGLRRAVIAAVNDSGAVCCIVVLATESLLQRMTIVGVLLSFRCLAQEALLDVC